VSLEEPELRCEEIDRVPVVCVEKNIADQLPKFIELLNETGLLKEVIGAVLYSDNHMVLTSFEYNEQTLSIINKLGKIKRIEGYDGLPYAIDMEIELNNETIQRLE